MFVIRFSGVRFARYSGVALFVVRLANRQSRIPYTKLLVFYPSLIANVGDALKKRRAWFSVSPYLKDCYALSK